MIDAQVTNHGLEVVLTDGDAWLFATQHRWEIVVPLEHVIRAKVAPPVGFAVRKHVHDEPGGVMVCARQRAPTVVIDLDGDPFRRMTLSVPDPENTVATIKGALRLQGR